MKSKIRVYFLDEFGKYSGFVIIGLAYTVSWSIEESIFLSRMAMKIKINENTIRVMDLSRKFFN